MAKRSDPWFKFYPRDWLEDTRGLTLEQRGAYIDAIAMQMEYEEALKDDFSWLAHQMHISSRKARAIAEQLIELKMLKRTSAGLVNERCLREIQAKVEQRRINAETAANRVRSDAGSRSVQLQTDAEPRLNRSRVNTEQTAKQLRARDENRQNANEINGGSPNSCNETVTTRAGARARQITDIETNVEKAPLKGGQKAADAGASAAPPKEAKASRATRLVPTGGDWDAWCLPGEWRDWALAHCEITPEGVEAEAARFVDHWRAAPGAKGRKDDWFATWRNWVRRDHKARERSQTSTKPGELRRPKDFWWRGREAVAKRMDADLWRAAIRNFANGSWPVPTLGPGPWDPACLVPDCVAIEMDLRVKYPTPDGQFR
jgi:uncharacterized protein YdaU (DUF1376 family)